MFIKFLVFFGGGGGILGLEGGKCRFYFYGRGDLSDQRDSSRLSLTQPLSMVVLQVCG